MHQHAVMHQHGRPQDRMGPKPMTTVGSSHPKPEEYKQ
jgi:hypothetical protein